MGRAFLAIAILFSIAASQTAAESGTPLARTSDDETRTVLGWLSAGGEPIQAEERKIAFTCVQGEGDRVPEAVKVDVRELASERRWSFALRPPAAVKRHTIVVPRGEYELVFLAPHHRAHRATAVAGKTDVDLGRRQLIRNPVISGVVRTKEGQAVAGALLSDAETKVSGSTDLQGRFALEIQEGWPARLIASYPGMATKEIIVPAASRSTTLPAITLTRGGTIRVRVDRANGDGDIKAELHSIINPLERHHRTSALLKKGENELAFNDLDSGDYAVVLRGEGPLEQYGVTFTLAEGESVEREIRIEPFEAELDVFRGAKPLAGAPVLVRHVDDKWESNIRVDEHGKFRATAWQRGSYTFWVTPAPNLSPYLAIEELDPSSSPLTLRLPDSAVHGLVLDAYDKPVEGAEVGIESTNDDGSGGMFRVTANAAGEFAFEALRPGRHIFTATAERYPKSDPVTVTIVSEDDTREITLRLKKGEQRAVEVVSRAGYPVRGASVIHAGEGGTFTAVYTTDDHGQVTLNRADPRSLLVVIPREGSMALSRLPVKPAADGEPLRVVVPEGDASLELRAVDADGQAIPAVRFLMRIDGELIHPDVANFIEVLMRTPLYTDRGGRLILQNIPSGFYEFWPLRTSVEAADIMASVTQEAPVRVGVRPGANTATMTFTHKR